MNKYNNTVKLVFMGHSDERTLSDQERILR